MPRQRSQKAPGRFGMRGSSRGSASALSACRERTAQSSRVYFLNGAERAHRICFLVSIGYTGQEGKICGVITIFPPDGFSICFERARRDVPYYSTLRLASRFGDVGVLVRSGDIMDTSGAIPVECCYPTLPVRMKIGEVRRLWNAPWLWQWVCLGVS